MKKVKLMLLTSTIFTIISCASSPKQNPPKVEDSGIESETTADKSQNTEEISTETDQNENQSDSEEKDGELDASEDVQTELPENLEPHEIPVEETLSSDFAENSQEYKFSSAGDKAPKQASSEIVEEANEIVVKIQEPARKNPAEDKPVAIDKFIDKVKPEDAAKEPITLHSGTVPAKKANVEPKKETEIKAKMEKPEISIAKNEEKIEKNNVMPEEKYGEELPEEKELLELASMIEDEPEVEDLQKKHALAEIKFLPKQDKKTEPVEKEMAYYETPIKPAVQPKPEHAASRPIPKYKNQEPEAVFEEPEDVKSTNDLFEQVKHELEMIDSVQVKKIDAAYFEPAAGMHSQTSTEKNDVSHSENESAKPNETAKSNEDAKEFHKQPVISEQEVTEIKVEEEPVQEKETVNHSRSVEMKKNQFLDISYPGKGWIYLGEDKNKSVMRYFGREINDSDTTFSLKTREEGSTTLHFYKNDALTGKYIDDYILVTVNGEDNNSERIKAPEYAEIVPPKPEKVAFASAEAEIKEEREREKEKEKKAQETQTARFKAKTVIRDEKKAASPSRISNETAKDSDEKAEPQKIAEETKKTEEPRKIVNTEQMPYEDILSLAKKCYKEKKFDEALKHLEAFFEKATSRLDEGFFLQGQTLEANSKSKNIKKSLAAYETIVGHYPSSPYWKRAKERAIYLKRFYINIR